MIYSLLRSVAAIALRWYYADVAIAGSDRIPERGPMLVVMNHPNALVDVLVAGRAVDQRLYFTGKSTLFANPVAAALLSWLGVIPLRRASDESGSAVHDPSRNADAFDAIARSLARRRTVLIFPEGKSHDEPAMAPLKSGAARIALHARKTAGVQDLKILPIGLVFERKDQPRSRVLANVGEPIDVGVEIASGADAHALTSLIDHRLRELTLNYESHDEAARVARVSAAVGQLLRADAVAVGAPESLRLEAAVARSVPAVRAAALRGSTELRARMETFERSLEDFDQRASRLGISLADIRISRGTGPGILFVIREGIVALLAAPFALWGWINHLIPFRAALAAGGRVKDSHADPAMRTIVAGAAFVLMVYMAQGAVVTLLAGPVLGLAYVLSLPITADINFRLRERLGRAMRRARTYLVFRRHPRLHDTLIEEAAALRGEAIWLANASGISVEA